MRTKRSPRTKFQRVRRSNLRMTQEPNLKTSERKLDVYLLKHDLVHRKETTVVRATYPFVIPRVFYSPLAFQRLISRANPTEALHVIKGRTRTQDAWVYPTIIPNFGAKLQNYQGHLRDCSSQPHQRCAQNLRAISHSEHGASEDSPTPWNRSS